MNECTHPANALRFQLVTDERGSALVGICDKCGALAVDQDAAPALTVSPEVSERADTSPEGSPETPEPTETDPLGVGARVAEVRTSLGVTQYGLAKHLGMNLWRLEKGHIEPSLASLRRIAEALGVTVRDLIPKQKKPKYGAFDLRIR